MVQDQRQSTPRNHQSLPGQQHEDRLHSPRREKEFGFAASEIGAKSIRSGAAMALFLSDVPVAKIMILGRWVSDAFLDYIRPQVLEWTSDMSLSMANVEHFLDIADPSTTSNTDPKQRTKLNNINGSTFLLPRFNLHH